MTILIVITMDSDVYKPLDHSCFSPDDTRTDKRTHGHTHANTDIHTFIHTHTCTQPETAFQPEKLLNQAKPHLNPCAHIRPHFPCKIMRETRAFRPKLFCSEELTDSYTKSEYIFHFSSSFPTCRGLFVLAQRRTRL